MDKPFLKSKLNLLGIVTFLAGAASFANYLPVEYQKWVLLVAGVAGVVLRTFFTKTEVKP